MTVRDYAEELYREGAAKEDTELVKAVVEGTENGEVPEAMSNFTDKVTDLVHQIGDVYENHPFLTHMFCAGFVCCAYSVDSPDVTALVGPGTAIIDGINALYKEAAHNVK